MASVPLRIALRYLFARKSKKVINWISGFCVAGITIGTAALILILSVYNGFDSLIRENLGKTDSEYLLVSKTSKFFEVPDGADGRKVLSDKVLVSYGGNQTIALAKGLEGATGVSVSEDLATTLKYRPQFSDHLQIYYPNAGKSISLLNLGASMNSISLRANSIMAQSSDALCPVIVLPIDQMRRLTGLSSEVSAIQLGSPVQIEGFDCQDQIAQHPTIFKMMRYEKAALFLILICVVVIVTFNIFSSLRMLQIEKEPDCQTLLALGMKPSGISRIFVLEGLLITGIALVLGLAIGLCIALLQSRLGIFIMPGVFQPYPVKIVLSDIALCAGSILAIGSAVTFLARR